MDVYGLAVLFVSLLVASALLTAAIFGAMFALHRYAAHRFPARMYGTFDFEHIEKTQLSEFLARIAAIAFPPTMILHLLEFLTVGIYIRAYPVVITLALFAFQTVAIGAGFLFILKLDRKRAIVLTSITAAVYLLLYWIFIFGYLQ